MKVPPALAAAVGACAAIALLFASPVKSDDPPAFREASFDTDPLWDGWGNRPVGGKLKCQGLDFSFGWIAPDRTSPAGAIGGTITRSTDYRAYYAKVLDQPATLDDALSASGVLRLGSRSKGGLLFGWFNGQTSFGWRTPDFLGLRLDGSRAFAEYGTSSTFAGTTAALSFSRRDTPWKLEYFPDGGTDGTGLLRLSIGSKVVEVAVRPSQRLDGARFDRFGLLNAQVQGPDMTARFSYLTVDGQQVDLIQQPGWEGSNNQLDTSDCVIHNQQDFGYSAGTQYAGGNPGEVGGIVWRTDRWRAYYGDPITPVGLGDSLYAEGNIDLEAATSDTDVFIGWFGTERKGGGDIPANLIAAQIGGPSAWGTRMFPAYRSGSDTSGTFAPLGSFDRFEDAPLLSPKHHVWSWWICYRPPADSSSSGRLTVGVTDPEGLVPDSQVSIKVRGAAVREGAIMNRFGIRSLDNGGHSLTFFLDNLRYTSGPGDAGPDDRCSPPS